MSERILFVDDDRNILSAFKRQFRKTYTVHIADAPKQALQVVQEKGPFAVVVSDMRMPGMDGVELLSRVRRIEPDTVRVILTGYADMDSAIAAVNEGHVFRFLTKPCPPEDLHKVLELCIRQFRLIRSEKELLQGTLRGTINVLTEVLSLVNPEAFGRATRVKRIVRRMAQYFQVPDVWRYDLAAMLSQLGCITLPGETLQKLYQGEELLPEEIDIYQSHPEVARSLLQHIPRLQEVIQMVVYQEKRFDGSGVPEDAVQGEDIPLGARILKLALDFDLLESRGWAKEDIFTELQSRQGYYDPQALKGLQIFLGEKKQYVPQKLPRKELKTGMIFGQNVYSSNGLLLVAQGQEASQPHLLRLKNFAENIGLEEPIRMFVPVDTPA